jgi:hypothetical protein
MSKEILSLPTLFRFPSIPRVKEISTATFARHYLEDNIEELKSRVIEGVNKIETLL